MKSPPCIVVIEDQQLFRQMLAQYLRRECGCEVAGEAPDGARGLVLCLDVKPDLALIDLQLPVMDGLALAERLHRQAPGIKLLAVSSRLDALTVYCVDRSPFLGFVDKEQDQTALKQALSLVMAGNRSFSEDYLALRNRINRDPNAFFKILSVREMEILTCIAQGRTNAEIAQQMGLSLRTVETHRYRIMTKLDISNGMTLMNYARHQGFEPLTLPAVKAKPKKP